MTQVLNIFTPSTSNVFFISAAAALCGFTLGFLVKAVAIAKQKRRVVSLEDEMLQNHARILDLEKQIAELKEEKSKVDNNMPVPKLELKAS
jgi:hypothetical protein